VLPIRTATRYAALAAALLAASLALAGCGAAAKGAGPRPAAAKAATPCPAAWKAGWQRLANQIHASVYCPSWMPNPLDGLIGGTWDDGRSVDKQGGYLVGFIDQENGTEVHVNFHRWPGTKMPLCRDLESKRLIACYSDPGGRLKANGIDATLYTVSRDADQWHLAYLWRHDGATYVVSEHVAPPFSYARVKTNVARLLRSLALVRPTA
jgi:hypothetical protein